MFYVWGEGSSGQQLFNKFATLAEALENAKSEGFNVLDGAELSADERKAMDWVFANPAPWGNFQTSFDAHDDSDLMLEEAGVVAEDTRYFGLCAHSHLES